MQAKPLRRLRCAVPWLALLAVLAGLAAVRGLDHCYNISYEITNGDFQNYNPVRHLLAGQVPFRDFTVYLGAGELYSVGAMLLVLGNSFGRSMFATGFLTWFCFELLVFAVCAVVMGKGRGARALAIALCGVLFMQVQGWVSLPGPFGAWLEYAADPGNSARMMRSAALPLVVLLSFALLRRPRHAPAQPTGGWRRFLPPWQAAVTPALAGALVVWSNDMGAAMYIAVALGYGLFLLRRYGRKISMVALRVAQYIAVSCFGLGAAVLLVSWGHPLAWLRQTRGSGAFQSWYYGTENTAKLCYIADYVPQLAGGICLALAVAFAVGIFRCKTDRSAVLAAGGFALCLGMQLWNLLYCLLSTVPQEGPAGGAQALLAALLPALAVRGALLLAGRLWRGKEALARALHRFVPAVCAGLGCLLVAAGGVAQVQSRIGGHEGLTHLPALGGWLGDQAGNLTTEQALAGEARLFGTYSSALEAMNGQLQPTGTDYIIHALGDRQRLHYLTTFQQGDFDLVVTPSPKVAQYERWSRNANWWFYRELYRWYAPVANTFNSGGMHLFWQRTGVCNDLGQEFSVEVSPAGQSVTITLTAAEPTFNGVADLRIGYAFDLPDDYLLRGGLYGFLLCYPDTETALWAERGREGGDAGFYLPTDRSVYNIPVTVADGTGTVTLQALPADAAAVTVTEAVVEASYTDWEYFFE